MSTLQTISSTVVDYPARDMTITAGAGMTFGALQTLLSTENQQLPIDVADDSITLGHLVANDICGPRQFGYGTLRDYVIGIEAVDGRGRVFHAGGRVVKNVAGYDLCRLLVGSRGELGTITQVTFKLKPLPVQQSLSVAGFRSWRDLDTALERMNLTATTPAILDVVGRYASASLLAPLVSDLADPALCSDALALLAVGFEGPAVSCEWQSAMLRDELHGIAGWTHVCVQPDAYQRYCRAVQQAADPSERDPWMARLITLPSRVVSAMTVLQDAGCELFGRAGNGLLYARAASTELTTREILNESTAFSHLQSLVADGVGSVTALKSSIARSTPSSPEVQAVASQLKELLGGAGLKFVSE